MKTHIATSLILTSLLLTGTVYAQGWALGGKAGTLGLGVELTKSITPHFNLRGGFNNFKYSEDYEDTNVTYDGDLNLRTFGGFIDWHPASRGIFRFTAGVLSNGNKADLTGIPTGGSFDIGGNSYPAASVGTLSGSVDFIAVSPYAGIGLGNSVGKTKSFSFSAEMGVLYQGSPEVNLSASGFITSDPTFMANLQQEENDINNSIEEYKYWPVIALGMSYRF